MHEHNLVNYAGDRLVRVRNWADEGYYIKTWFWQRVCKVDVTASAPSVIVKRARKLLKDKKRGKYHLFKNNCEVFATTCRYGEGFSGQSIGWSWGWGGWYQ